MLFYLLAEAADGVGGTQDYSTYIFLGVMILLIVVYFIFSNRQRKKQREEYEKKMDGLAIGDKVTTIGMWVGEIVEILPDGNYVLKTGTDEHVGYITVNRQAIYTIAKPEDEQVEELPTELPTEEVPVFEDMTGEQVEETPVEDALPAQDTVMINGEPQE